jgi:hypothetical protein
MYMRIQVNKIEYRLFTCIQKPRAFSIWIVSMLSNNYHIVIKILQCLQICEIIQI